MGTYEELKAAIQQVITTNGNNEITGALLQQTLLSIVNSMGKNTTFAGIATPETNPGTPDQSVFFIATQAGTYINFNNIELLVGEVAIIENKTGSWTKKTTGIATQKQMEKGLMIPYFAAGNVPKFSISENNISIIFPEVAFRIYNGDGSIAYELNPYNESFELDFFKQLILENGIMKVVDLSYQGDYLRLLSLDNSVYEKGYYVEGLLSNYFNVYFFIEKDNIIASTTIYPDASNRNLIIEQDTTNGYIYLYTPIVIVRNKSVSTQYTMQEIAQELGVELVTSPNGVTNCIAIPNLNVLCFNVITGKFQLRTRDNILYWHIKICESSSGICIYIHPNFLNVTQLTESIETALNTARVGYMVYFASATYPKFENYDNKVSVTFPNDSFRIYDPMGEVVINTNDFIGQTYQINSFEQLIFDLETNTISKIAINEEGRKNYVRLLAVTGNAVWGLFKPYYDIYGDRMIEVSNYKTAGQIYLSGYNRPLSIIEENIKTGNVYFTFKEELYVRCLRTNRSVTIELLAQELGVELVTSPNGVTNCIAIPNLNVLCFNVINDVFEIIHRDNINNNHIVLISASSGFILEIHPNLVNIIDVKKVIGGGFSVNDRYNYTSYRNLRDNIFGGCTLKGLFFSDIHASLPAANRIVELANMWQSSMDVIIDGGDDAVSYNQDGTLAPLDAVFSECRLPILRCVGNHDAWHGGTWDWDTNENIYNAITEKVVEQLAGLGKTIVQPSDVETTFANYYYYDCNDVRVIVLCSLGLNAERYWDNEQYLWFTNVLEDSRINNKSVLCVNHGIIPKENSVSLQNNWDSYIDWSNGGIADYQHVNQQAIDAVDEYIEAGGKFVAWIGGHTHCDILVKTKTNNFEQLAFATSSAKIGNSTDGVRPTSVYANGYDLFNIIGVDTQSNLFKVQRLGFNTNKALQRHESFVWNYQTRKLISVVE